jgi:protein TonB
MMKKFLLSICFAAAVNFTFFAALSTLGTPVKKPVPIRPAANAAVEILPAVKSQTRARVLPNPSPSAHVPQKPEPLRSGAASSKKRRQTQTRSSAPRTASVAPNIDLKPDPNLSWAQADIFLPEIPVETALSVDCEVKREANREEVHTLPVKVKHIQPEYPKWALSQGLEGTVWLVFLIDQTGKVADVRITRSSLFAEFDASAVLAVKQWRYKPARREAPVAPVGEPVAVWQPCVVRFQINQ